MKFPAKYDCVDFDYIEMMQLSIRPIRYEDREPIRTWRNDQIDILRQENYLTELDQDAYFKNNIHPLFTQSHPNQILVGFYNANDLIGYGGLVHIDWKNSHAEISFLLATAINSKDNYLNFFTSYLVLIEKLAIKLKLNKIHTFGYDLEKFRFDPLISSNFKLEAKLKQHKLIGTKLIDVLIYSKII